MKANNIISLIILVLFTTFAQAQVRSIEPDELLNLLKSKQAPLILDVRTEQEFKDGHIEGAVNIPYDQLSSKSKILALYKEQDIVIYCRTGRRAQAAQHTLQWQGFKNLMDLNGHMISWNQRHYPLIK